MGANVLRLLTEADVDASRNLKKIYLRKKRSLNLSQVKLAKAVGMKQATISQYMNGVIALNTPAVLSFSKALRVHPADIDPRLGQLLSQVCEFTSESKKIPIIHSTSGKYDRGGYIQNTGYGVHVVAGIVDTNEYAPEVPKDSVVVINSMAIMRPQSMVAIRKKGSDTMELAMLLDIDDDADKVTLYPVDGIENDSYQIEMGVVASMQAVKEIKSATS